MAIIDYTIFRNHLNLVVDDVNTRAGVTQTIDEYEGHYLMKALGRTFGQLFVTGLGVNVGGGFSDGFSDGFDIGGIDQRWLWLRDGHDYTFRNGLAFNYGGIKQAIAGYVYYWYRRDNATYTGAVGNENRSANENSVAVAPNDKLYRAWDVMATQGMDLLRVLQYAVNEDGDSIYPEFGVDAYSCFVNYPNWYDCGYRVPEVYRKHPRF